MRLAPSICPRDTATCFFDCPSRQRTSMQVLSRTARASTHSATTHSIYINRAPLVSPGQKPTRFLGHAYPLSVHTIVLCAFSQAERRCALLAQRCNSLQSPLVLMIKARSCRKGARVKGHASSKLHLHLKHASKICSRSAN